MTLKIAMSLCILLAVSPQRLMAQARAPELFDSRNAIIDTGIPFAIGAQEAQQSLRGSFGWQTFQEGLVEGVYYRFDPDGYARFAPTPRLDQDQFEVVCVPRSNVCAGQKGPLHVALTQRGQVQIQLENLGAGDQFYLGDGTSELPLPSRILEPLDIRLESLLMAGGEFVTKRNGQPVNSVSLTGFSAVVAYIRWVAAGQDYSVLPRNWPIPNSVTTAENRNITQPDTWIRPGAASQSVVPWPNANVAVGDRRLAPLAPFDPTRPLTRILAEGADAPLVDTALDDLKREIAVLNAQLEGRTTPKPLPLALAPQPLVPLAKPDPLVTLMVEQNREIQANLYKILDRLDLLEQSILSLGRQQQAMLPALNTQLNSSLGQQPSVNAPQLLGLLPGGGLGGVPSSTLTAVPGQPLGQPPVQVPLLSQLPLVNTANIGGVPGTSATPAAPSLQTSLEADIARMLTELAALKSADTPGISPSPANLPAGEASPVALNSRVVLERSVVEQILKELDRSSLPESAVITPPTSPATPAPVNAETSQNDSGSDYQTLSDYFKSVVSEP